MTSFAYRVFMLRMLLSDLRMFFTIMFGVFCAGFGYVYRGEKLDQAFRDIQQQRDEYESRAHRAEAALKRCREHGP